MREILSGKPTFKSLTEDIKSGKLFHSIMLINQDKEYLGLFACELAVQILGEDARVKIEKGIHPDVKVFGEETVLNSDSARELIESVNIRPYEGDKKVYILKSFDEVNDTTMNKLLKTLEEPPLGTFFILLVRNSSKVLQTILSRAMKYNVEGLTPDELTNILEKEGVGSAGLIAMQSGYNLERAHSLVDQGSAGDILKLAEEIFIDLDSTLKFDMFIGFSERLKKIGLVNLVDFMTLLAEDTLRLKTKKQELVQNKSMDELYKKISAVWSIYGLLLVLDALLEAKKRANAQTSETSNYDQLILKILEVRIKCKR